MWRQTHQYVVCKNDQLYYTTPLPTLPTHPHYEGWGWGVECVPRHNDYKGLGEAERFGVENSYSILYVYERIIILYLNLTNPKNTLTFYISWTKK